MDALNSPKTSSFLLGIHKFFSTISICSFLIKIKFIASVFLSIFRELINTLYFLILYFVYLLLFHLLFSSQIFFLSNPSHLFAGRFKRIQLDLRKKKISILLTGLNNFTIFHSTRFLFYVIALFSTIIL